MIALNFNPQPRRRVLKPAQERKMNCSLCDDEKIIGIAGGDYPCPACAVEIPPNTSLERQLRNQIKDLLAALDVAETVLSDIYNRENKSSFHGQRVRADIEDSLKYIRTAIAEVKEKP